MTDITASKPCIHCGAPIFRSSGSNFKRRKFCGTECPKLHDRAKGPARFWSKVEKTATCWLYTGFRKWDGYGWLNRNVDGKPRWLTAHRYAWILTHGEPPAGMHIMHLCDVPACCNPAHLKLGTHDDNMADMAAKGRGNSGQIKKYKPVLYPDRVRPRRPA